MAFEGASEAARSGRGRKCLQPEPQSSREAWMAPGVSGPSGRPRRSPGPGRPGSPPTRSLLQPRKLTAGRRAQLRAADPALHLAVLEVAFGRAAPISTLSAPEAARNTRRHLRAATPVPELAPPPARPFSRRPITGPLRQATPPCPAPIVSLRSRGPHPQSHIRVRGEGISGN